MDSEMELWRQARQITPEQIAVARQVLHDVRTGGDVFKILRRYPLPGGGYLAKHVLVAAYHQMVADGELPADSGLLARIRMKPVRTLSGVTTVTVLTKPYPCPGKCVFCPTDARLPKSYLADEPGARRALQHQFDPYTQVAARLEALTAVGHPTDKIELLILGGTWSAYRKDYQDWFIRRCFDALNGLGPDDPGAATVEEAHTRNEDAPHRNVGLVIETRPDEVNPAELAWLRRLGVTKVQMGAQSLDDRILQINQRGHTAAETLDAVRQLRAAGFKIVLHWMPNLLGATLDSDRADFARLFAAGYCPDEIKIYPCQLLRNADLYAYWERGEYTPYTQAELVGLIADIKPGIPPYTRVNRVIRDIPSTNVVAGNKRTSLRMDIQAELARRGQQCGCIRCHEVRGQAVDPDGLRLEDYSYHPPTAREHFLHFRTPEGLIAGYLRLSLPDQPTEDVSPDLAGAAIIREVHVYGQSLAVGADQAGAAQHAGLGTRLLEAAREIARQHGYQRLAVIAAVGTRRYYLARGFQRGELYLVQPL